MRQLGDDIGSVLRQARAERRREQAKLRAEGNDPIQSPLVVRKDEQEYYLLIGDKNDPAMLANATTQTHRDLLGQRGRNLVIRYDELAVEDIHSGKPDVIHGVLVASRGEHMEGLIGFL